MDFTALKAAYPWPDTQPEGPRDMQGWFGGNHEAILNAVLNDSTKFIVELGSWKGLSTEFLLRRAPNAVVAAVDHWKGSPEHVEMGFSKDWEHVYDQFLHNLWDYRERLIPVRELTTQGMARIREFGLCPDLVYVDAAHDTESCLVDIETAYRLFPGAIICGDDWNWDSVRLAVVKFAQANGLSVKVKLPAWIYYSRTT